jgi:ABC-type multidrug transport system fused ATPase/permease subunit
MDQEPVVMDLVQASPSGPIEPSLRFESVDFTYPAPILSGEDWNRQESVHTLSGIDLVMEPGARIALVGPSGGGKSTIANLILRFWDPDQGVITLGGYDLRDILQEDLRRMIAVVSQQTFIFNTTIQDNLLLGKADASLEEIREAARLASIDEFFSALPDGYQTVIGEKGVKLSGGQRQRLAIARALLKDATILILDEATSNLDAESENKIQIAMNELMKGRTTLVIAHRLSTVIDADQILVIDQGRIVQRGTHAELVAETGLYSRLYLQV